MDALRGRNVTVGMRMRGSCVCGIVCLRGLGGGYVQRTDAWDGTIHVSGNKVVVLIHHNGDLRKR